MINDKVSSFTNMIKELKVNITSHVTTSHISQTDANHSNDTSEIEPEDSLSCITSFTQFKSSSVMENFRIERRDDDDENPSVLVCNVCESYLGLPK